MRKFQFRFQAVLQERKRREEEALVSLATAQRNHQAELSRKAELVAGLAEAHHRLSTLAHMPVRIEAFWAEQDYIAGTQQRIVQADQAILRTYRYLEKEMRSYLLCKRRTRAMEILQDKALLEFKKEVSKHEAKELDDLNSMRFAHREAVI